MKQAVMYIGLESISDKKRVGVGLLSRFGYSDHGLLMNCSLYTYVLRLS